VVLERGMQREHRRMDGAEIDLQRFSARLATMERFVGKFLENFEHIGQG
jgi:hypothetical protein